MTFLDILTTVAIEWCCGTDCGSSPRPNVRVWLMWNSPVLSTCWASVEKFMQGSRKLNKAHDFDLKLMPWKQASEMFLPCNSIVPPKTVPFLGKGFFSVEMHKPIACLSGFCQCRWWRASNWMFSSGADASIFFLNCFRLKLFSDCNFGSRFVKTLFDDLNCCEKKSSSL